MMARRAGCLSRRRETTVDDFSQCFIISIDPYQMCLDIKQIL